MKRTILIISMMLVLVAMAISNGCATAKFAPADNYGNWQHEIIGERIIINDIEYVVAGDCKLAPIAKRQ